MRNSLSKIATSLAALAFGVSLAATPALAFERHGDGARHVAAVHRDGRHVGDRHSGRWHGGGRYSEGGEYYGGCGYYDQGCGREPGLVGGVIGGALGAIQGY